MAFPNFDFSINPYNITNSTTNSGRNGPPRSDEFACASVLPPHGYTNSQDRNGSFNLSRSIGLESVFPVSSSSMASGLIWPGQDINAGFDISRGSRCGLPSGNQPVLSAPFGHVLEGYGGTPPFVAHNFISTFNLQGFVAPNQTIPTELGDFHDINSTGILIDDLQMPSCESFFSGLPGWYPPQPFMPESD